eukprot:XP_020408154.1 uncharacterized protein LOC109946027 [Zea mays]
MWPLRLRRNGRSSLWALLHLRDLCRSSLSLAHRRHSYLPLAHRTIRKEVERWMASSTPYSRTQLRTEAAAKAPTTLAAAVRECASISTFSVMNTSISTFSVMDTSFVDEHFLCG